MNNSNPIEDLMVFNGQQDVQTMNLPKPGPPPLSMDNSEDLTLVLSAVKETQSNLRLIQPMVMQLGDPIAMEDIAKAFKLTASSSQFVLTSDLPSAYTALEQAWATMRHLESQFTKVMQHREQTQQQQQQQQTNLNMMSNATPNMNTAMYQGSGMMGQMPLPQAAQNQIVGVLSPSNEGRTDNHSGIQNEPTILSNNTYIPKEKKKKGKAETSIKPTGGSNPIVDRSNTKVPPKQSKGKSELSNKKVYSMSSPPPEDIAELKDIPPQSNIDPVIMMARLQGFMDRTLVSQKRLQGWDKKNGLPKSHSQTMVNTSRSRKQLQKGVILRKWNGVPLISGFRNEGASSQGEQDKSLQEESEQTEIS